jgi:hypothetical protein
MRAAEGLPAEKLTGGTRSSHQYPYRLGFCARH